MEIEFLGYDSWRTFFAGWLIPDAVLCRWNPLCLTGINPGHLLHRNTSRILQM